MFLMETKQCIHNMLILCSSMMARISRFRCSSSSECAASFDRIIDLMNRALKVAETFFESSDEEKLKSSPDTGAPLPVGYRKEPEPSPDKKEFLSMLPPGSDFSVYPENPPEFQEVVEEMFRHLAKTGLLIESILNECLGPPPNFLREYNHDRSWDLMAALRYFPATNGESSGVSAHKDPNIITFVLQDDVGGLEVLKDGEWIPIIPAEGTIVVNIRDVIQVLSNNKFKSAIHRVVSPKGKNRYSFTFFYNLQGDKWVEPLAKFTKEIDEAPKYRRFLYKEYLQLIMSRPPSSPQDTINITHYAIPST